MLRYGFGCERPILSNTYYPALVRDNVDVVTEGIERVDGRTIVTRDGAGGRWHEVDTVITVIGFRYGRSQPVNRVIGSDGRTLGESWSQSPTACLGTTVPGFPNMFILLGPSAIAINPVNFSLTSQIAYAMYPGFASAYRCRTRRVDQAPYVPQTRVGRDAEAVAA